MDYDDNDILHHNPQLAGEGRSRSSSVLRPYDFPKFDFDNSFQGHLRFDGLVETEVFLGIQSQEDNQWIEDFSRGSNGMEFNSTPADSCSISRRYNVWSEATSSESVEMLLKSVGQEEIMPGETTIQDSNTCNYQGTVTEHVELGSMLDEKSDVKIGNSEAELPQEEFPQNHPCSGGHVEEQLHEAEYPSQATANVESACVSSSNLVYNAAHGQSSASANEGSNSYLDGCSNENLKELKSSDGKSMKCGAEEDSLFFVKTVDNINSNVVALSGSKISPKMNANVPCDSCSNDREEKNVLIQRVQEETEVPAGKTDEAGIDTHSVSSSLCLVAESVVKRQDAVEGSLNYVGKTADKSIDRMSEMTSSKEDRGNGLLTTSLQTEKQEVEILPSNIKLDVRFEGCQDHSVVDGIDQHSGDLGCDNAPHFASSEQKMSTPVQLTSSGDGDKMEGLPGTPLENESISTMPLFSVDNKEVSINNDECSDATENVNKSSDMLMLSPGAENQQTDNNEGCHTDARVILEEPASHLPTCVTDNFKLVIGENLDHMQTDSAETKQDMCITKEQDRNLSIDAGNADAQNVTLLKGDRRIQLSDLSKEVKESGASGAPNDLTESKQNQPVYSDNDPKESATRIEPDEDFRTEVDGVSKVEVSVIDDAHRTSHSEISAVSPLSMEKSNEVSSRKSPCIAATNSSESNQSQADLVHDRSLKESTNSELVFEKNNELRRKTEEEKEPVQSSEVDKASCGSPTIITSSEPSQMEKDNDEQATGFEVTDKLVNDIQLSAEDRKRDDMVGDDTSFTFNVTALPDTIEREPGKCWSPFPILEKCHSSVAVKQTIPSGEGKTVRTPSKKTPRQSARVSEGEYVPGTSKGTSERKGRRSSSKGMAKENAKGNQAKRTKLEIPPGKGEKVSSTLLSGSSISSKLVQLGQIERSDTKFSSAVAIPTSNLPDLNTSASGNNSSPSASFRQPFTDLQQVQLRAQIFVYGSLIQGTAPDEACMISAFAQSDGGRAIWEPVWLAAVERVRSQKSNPSAAETPLHAQSGPRSSDAAVKQSPHSSKLLLSPVSRSGSKGTPAAVVNPIIPLSSPLGSISTPLRDGLPSTSSHKGAVADYQHVATPMHSFQTPPIRNFVGHASWPSQTCFSGPWIASPRTSTLNSNVCFQPVTVTETVKLTPVKETSGPVASGMKHITSSPVQTIGLSPVYVGIPPLPDHKAVSSAEKHSLDAKPRKRKKVPASDPCQVSLVSESRTEPLVVTNVTAILSSPVVVPNSAGPSSDAVLSKAAADASAVYSNDCSPKSDLKTQNAVSCLEETLTKVAEAKSHSEDASALAAFGVKHSEDLWSQLAKQDSGLVSEAEAKLASAAVAIEAAASVTKAAAAAAKVAYNAALQAKLMVDEALFSNKTSLVPCDGKPSTDLCDVRNAMSILKGDNITNQSNSILVAAKEAAKRRIEAASAASKQAENLVAIVKAAELAATAVSQAGKIVAMGEPLPLSDLVEAGSEGYWKLVQPSCELAGKPTDKNKDYVGTEGTNTSAKVSREASAEKGGIKALTHKKIHSRRRSSETLDGHVNVVNGIGGSGHNAERFKNEKGFEVSDSARPSAVVTESDTATRTGSIQNELEDVGVLHEDSIKEGSVVEVFKHGVGVKSAWYSANVLTLEDGKAFVCYSDLLSEKGSGNLCEWVPLEGDGDKAPIIRPAHPTGLQSQGTRKRPRAALGDYAWCIGDRVDVWINDCWWEGVVTEKTEKDDTTLKVHFPAQGETSTVRGWNLRTSRLWTDGKWVEWSPSGGHNSPEKSDTPQEKRQKMGSPIIPTEGKDKSAIDVDYASGKPEELELALSTGDRVFNIGKTSKDDGKHATRRLLRAGQQKEGSRVIFGLPKPTGKKRKFMEVSKHFSTNRADKSNETSDSVKFAKYLIPQTATPPGWKVPGRNDSKERRTAASRSRAPGFRKPTRTLAQRNDLESTIAQDGDNVTSHGNDVDDSVGHDENSSEKEHGFPACEEKAEAPLSSLLTTSSKKMPPLNTKSERLNKERLAPAGGKMSKIEDQILEDDSGKSVPEVTEPRRSNRRIRPTHRLLEGLQSSMIIPKMPSVSHDKGLSNQNRNVSTKGKLL